MINRRQFSGAISAALVGSRAHAAGKLSLHIGHTGLTWMADAGVPVHVLRKIAGHGSLSTTQRYLHPDQRSYEEAGSALSAHLATRAGTRYAGRRLHVV